MRVLVYTCPEASASERCIAFVYYDDGSRAPVAISATDAEAAEANARAWYASELERIAKQSAPRKPRAKKVEAAPVDVEEDEEVI